MVGKISKNRKPRYLSKLKLDLVVCAIKIPLR